MPATPAGLDQEPVVQLPRPGEAERVEICEPADSHATSGSLNGRSSKRNWTANSVGHRSKIRRWDSESLISGGWATAACFHVAYHPASRAGSKAVDLVKNRRCVRSSRPLSR